MRNEASYVGSLVNFYISMTVESVVFLRVSSDLYTNAAVIYGHDGKHWCPATQNQKLCILKPQQNIVLYYFSIF